MSTTTKKLRWTGIDAENFENDQAAQRAVSAWAGGQKIHLGDGLAFCAAWAIVRRELGAESPTPLDAIDDYNKGRAMVLDCGEWRRLTPGEVESLAALRVRLPNISRHHLRRWDARHDFARAAQA